MWNEHNASWAFSLLLLFCLYNYLSGAVNVSIFHPASEIGKQIQHNHKHCLTLLVHLAWLKIRKMKLVEVLLLSWQTTFKGRVFMTHATKAIYR